MEDEKIVNKGGAPSFLKNKEKALNSERIEEIEKSKPFFDNKLKVVFVNGSKYRRAKDIIALIRGEKAAVKSEDLERKDHYSRQLAAHQIELDSPEALPALYELLGGLIRTPAQQKNADEQAKEAKAKGRRRMIE